MTACEPFGDRIRSYCDTGDVYCDLGNVTSAHGAYFRLYATDTAEWIVKQFREVQLVPSGSNDTTGSGSDGGGATTTTGSGDGSAPTPTETPAAGAAGMVARVSWAGVLAGVIGTVGFVGML